MNQVLFGDDAMQRVIKGMDAVANAVKVTAGPGGRTVLIANDDVLLITKDGVTVARSVMVDDEVEQIGAVMLKKVAIETVTVAGDGTTTAVILAQSMIRSGIEKLKTDSKINPVQMKKGIDAVVNHVVNFLKENSVKIEDDLGVLKHVATISANGDEEIGNMIYEAYKRIGKDGILEITDSATTETYTKEMPGLQFDRGYLNPVFINDKEKMQVRFNNPLVLVCDFAVSESDDLLPIMNYCAKQTKSLVVIAPEINGTGIIILVDNKQKGNLNSVAIKAPAGGVEYLRDICAITGATLVEEQANKFKQKDINNFLGTCDTITVKKDQTTITVDKQKRSAELQKYIAGLKTQGDAAEEENIKKHFKQRAAKLEGNINVLYVGGVTPTEAKEKSDRVEDAVQAVRCAIEEGVVPGGATMYMRAKKSYIDKLEPQNNSFFAGESIVLNALDTPFKQLIENSGAEIDDDEKNDILSGDVYDFKNYELIPKNSNIILDPAKVERIALENAASIAAVFLSTAAVVSSRK